MHKYWRIDWNLGRWRRESFLYTCSFLYLPLACAASTAGPGHILAQDLKYP